MLLGLVLGIGGGAHCRKRILVLAFRIKHPGSGDLPLDVHLLGPIGVLGLTQLVAQFSELGDLGLSRRPACPSAPPRKLGRSASWLQRWPAGSA